MRIGSSEKEKEKEVAQLCEIIEEKLYFAPLSRPEDSATVQGLPKPAKTFSIDDELVRISPNALPPKPRKNKTHTHAYTHARIFIYLYLYDIYLYLYIITFKYLLFISPPVSGVN